jgi:polyribonucleotide 5'-hydroxyl-kinase
MNFYINIHSAFNQQRNLALKNRQIGPTIMVTGALRSGKSSLCRILVNYSLKLGWRPMLVDLDLKNNEISAPGTIAAVTVDESLPNDDLIQNALCFFQGQTLPDATPDFFDKQVSEMATSVRAKLENDLKLFNDEHMIEG